MSKNLSGTNVADFLDDGLGIEPEERPGMDMVIVEPTAVRNLKETDSVIKDTDIAEDYNIARVTLHETLEQLQEVVKAAAQTVQTNPDPKSIEAFQKVVAGVNQTTENLFGMHLKIQKTVAKPKQEEEIDDYMTSTSDFVNSLTEKE